MLSIWVYIKCKNEAIVNLVIYYVHTCFTNTEFCSNDKMIFVHRTLNDDHVLLICPLKRTCHSEHVV